MEKDTWQSERSKHIMTATKGPRGAFACLQVEQRRHLAGRASARLDQTSEGTPVAAPHITDALAE